MEKMKKAPLNFSFALFLASYLLLTFLPASSRAAGLPLAGPYQVGYINTLSVQADTDSNVNEVYIRVWYPVDPAIDPAGNGFSHAKYDGGMLQKDFAADVTKPFVLADRAWDGNGGNLPAAKGPFPVVLATPSFSFPPDIVYGQYAEALASQGIVVALVENTNDGLRCRLKRNDCTTNNIPSLFETSSQGRIRVSDTRSNDMIAGLSKLEALSQSHPVLGGRLNLSRMGLFGFSMGGPSSLSFLAKTNFDPRFKALIFLDPAFVPQEPNNYPQITLPTLLVSVSITGSSIRPGLTPIDPSQLFVGGYDPLTFAASCPAPISYLDVPVCLAVYNPGTPQIDLLNAPELAGAIGTPNGKVTHAQLRYAAHDGFTTCKQTTYLDELTTLFNASQAPGVTNAAELANILAESKLPCEKTLYDGQLIKDVYGIDLLDQTTQSAVTTQYLVAFTQVNLLGNSAYNSLLGLGAAKKLNVPMFFWTSSKNFYVIDAK